MGSVRVPLRGGLSTLLDEDFAASVSGRRLWAHRGKRRLCHDVLYAVMSVGGNNVGPHRVVMGDPPRAGLEVDHINGDGLDNRRANLRWASRQQNSANAQCRGRSSRFKGVCFDKSRGLWVAGVRFNHRRINLGRFRDEEAAARAYDAKARELFGAFARTNFP